MLDYVLICLAMIVIVAVPCLFLAVALRIIDKVVRSSEKDTPCYDPENPPSDPLEDEGEAYLNRRTL